MPLSRERARERANNSSLPAWRREGLARRRQGHKNHRHPLFFPERSPVGSFDIRAPTSSVASPAPLRCRSPAPPVGRGLGPCLACPHSSGSAGVAGGDRRLCPLWRHRRLHPQWSEPPCPPSPLRSCQQRHLVAGGGG